MAYHLFTYFLSYRTERGVMSEADRPNETASITATILEEEEARKAALAEETADTVLPDDLLPGVGDDEMTFREGVQKAGFNGTRATYPVNC